MIFNVLLYSSLAIFAIGSLYRIFTWFARQIGPPASPPSSFFNRLPAAAAGIARTIFSLKILTFVTSLLLDVLLLRKTLRTSFSRWVMHMLIFYGFILLLAMHALEKFISEPLFADYYSTASPFLFLRDFLGLLVLAGTAIALYRRFFYKQRRLISHAKDYVAIIFVAGIILSGVLLEGAKFTSYSAYQNMVDEYAGFADDDELAALESFWVKYYGTVSPNVSAPFDEEILSQGQDANENYCASCHATNKSGFLGFAIAKAVKPAAVSLDRLGYVNFFWYLHILFCFVGLAYLPFSKMFHVIATPVSLMANAVMDEKKSKPVNITTRQAMEVDACTHCGTCSLTCSALMAYEASGNPFILPSEKMSYLTKLASGKPLSRKEEAALLEGVYVCTSCERCTAVCPSGINLKSLWVNVKEILLERGHSEPFVLTPLSFVRGLTRNGLAEDRYVKPAKTAMTSLTAGFESIMTADAPMLIQPAAGGPGSNGDNFSHCFGCRNCTTVCPIVGNLESPESDLGLLPHQIMYCLALGMTEAASRATMIWDCLTCYQCQEHCPQNVKVCDILYRLKQQAVKNFNKDKQ